MRQQWRILDHWLVEDQYRVILKNVGSQLIDITADYETIREITSKVLNSSWTIDEFMRYLKEKGLAA